MKRILLLIWVAALVSACKENDVDEAPTRPIFSFTLKDDIYEDYENSETWIVIRDNETGDLIDSKQVMLDQPVVFESNAPISSNKLAITLLRAHGSTSKHTYSYVYNGIDLGSNWVFVDKGDPDVDPLQSVGSFNFTIEDVPSVRRFAISDRYGEYGYNFAYENNTITGSNSIMEGGPRQLVVVDDGTKPKYQWIEGLVGGEDVTLSFNDFKDFDSYITVDIPDDRTANAFIEGFESEIEPLFGYTVYPQHGIDINSTPPLDDLTLGFLDELQNYNTFASSGGTGSWSYKSSGAKPASIEFMDGHEFQVAGKTIDDFSLTASRSYNYSFSSYNNVDGTHVLIAYDPAGTVKHHAPYTDDLIAKYSIAIKDLEWSSSFISVEGDDTYENRMKILFDPAYPRRPTKQISVSKF